jgi:uncharacterized ion transporter superfamily protein YfcC
VVICSPLFFTFKNIFEFILSHCEKERRGNQELILLSVSIFLSAEKAEQKGFSLLSGLKTTLIMKQLLFFLLFLTSFSFYSQTKVKDHNPKSKYYLQSKRETRFFQTRNTTTNSNSRRTKTQLLLFMGNG